jgi:hypothetical protein
MPFKSDKQRKYLYKNHPDVAKKFAKHSKKKGGKKKGRKRRGK